MLPSSKTYGFWLALARIFTGGLFVSHALPKFTHADKFLPPNGFITQVVAGSITSTTGWYHDFLLNMVQPHIAIFAELIRAGEILVGCVLILGIFTRLGGLVGMFLMFNYIMVQGGGGAFHDWTGLEGAVFVLCALNAVIPTGRVLGLDALLAMARKPRVVPIVTTPSAAPTITTATGPVAAEFVDEEPLDGPSAPHE